MNGQRQTDSSRGQRSRIAMALALASLATAGALVACTTSVDGKATFAGGGSIVATGSESVPDPSDATVTTEESEPSTTTATAAPPALSSEQSGYCYDAYVLSGGFLTDWDAATQNGPDVDADVRTQVATSINNTINAMYPIVLKITEPTVRPLFDQLLVTLQGLAGDVAGGNSANLDGYNDEAAQIKSACSI